MHIAVLVIIPHFLSDVETTTSIQNGCDIDTWLMHISTGPIDKPYRKIQTQIESRLRNMYYSPLETEFITRDWATSRSRP